MKKKLLFVVLSTMIAVTGLGWLSTCNSLDANKVQLESTVSSLTIVGTELESSKRDLENVRVLLDTTEAELADAKSDLEELKGINEELLVDSETLKRMQSGFNTREELVEWLCYHHNATQYNEYSYNCEDFAKQLSRWARLDGYYLGLLEVPVSAPNLPLKFEFGTWYFVYHAKNFAIIGDEIYEIEPQDNTILLLNVEE